MVTLQDVAYVKIGSACAKRHPCGHSSKIVLNDGRIAEGLDSVAIWSIIKDLAKEKINPGKEWGGESVKEHFRQYENISLGGWSLTPADEVLNAIFNAQVLTAY